MRIGIIAALLLSAPLLGAEKIHEVKKGETLSGITKENLGAPIYGNDGNLQKLLTANKEITNPDLILINQKIAIPFLGDTNTSDEVNLELAATLKNKLTGTLQSASAEKSKWDFALDARAFVTTLGVQKKSTALTKTVNSDLSFGATGNIYLEGTDWYQARLELGIDKIKYKQKNIAVKQDGENLASAILGNEFLYKNQILIGLYGGLKERLVANKLTDIELSLEKKAIAQVGLGTAFILSELGKNKMALELSGNLLLENSGREFGAEISIIRSRTTISPFLNYTTFDTIAGQQDNLGTGINLSYQL
tara:strand:+ start:35403 stop:36323 length:921 start_codon:yes stop_codon:yes gene_type:complete